MRKLKCPNCGENMQLVKIKMIWETDKYDKWECKECCHIIVLDYRSD